MDRTWMPMVAGILDIIAGALTVIGGFIYLIIGGSSYAIFSDIASTNEEYILIFSAIFIAIAILLIIIGILAIVGGVFALRKRIWGLSLAGSIAALFPFWPLGIASIVFTALSKNDFD